ncbi:hydrolase [Halalkalibacter nanhaiisediminis]|uniref:Nicotinamidase-related amidase n=1 Tax=Halalkalibacter nanhaiisediminis TaxID=688079 RepID=A0A562QQC9_9BACI|nr:hydrolase [Halalkalibacter nanhaiisediminis]TWI58962.1 nicotinamidase-related amidase [Halalkalibacter nanhaiisediminis]
MLKGDQTVFVLVDVQGKLARIVHESEKLVKNLTDLIQGLQILNIPIIWVEQYPEGLGPTLEEVSQHLEGMKPIPKLTFDACKNESFIQALKKSGRTQILVAGIEGHICVHQTSMGLHDMGYEVQVVADAISSRTLENKEIGLAKMKAAGMTITSVETALFEIMHSAEGEQFKQLIKLLK